MRKFQQPSGMNFKKYVPFEQQLDVNLPDRTWPDKVITQAPRWCAVDLRDGNQALVNPMDSGRKMAMFELLVEMGYKEIEVGFPSASQTDFDFVRQLIDEDRIPEDVHIQVLTQSREHLIERTYEAIEGAPRAIVHLYNSTSVLQRRVVFREEKSGIIDIATRGAMLCRKYEEQLTDTEVVYQYSPESFTGTELEFAAEISNRVAEVLEGRTVELILITHHHLDHTGAVQAFTQRFGAPVRAVQEQWSDQAAPLVAHEVIHAAGTNIRVVPTPGHTSDSVSFFLPDDNAAPHPGGTVLTGDTILGEGTTMLDYPDGTLDDYLSSLTFLAALEGVGRQVAVLPAHGPTLDSVARTAEEYRAHRLERVDQLRELIQDLPPIITPVDWESVVVHDLSLRLYPKLPDMVRGPAKKTLAATLDYLLRNEKD